MIEQSKMPIELITLERGRHVLGPGDRGFLISLTKLRWTKQSGSEIMKLLKSFGQQYYEEKFPDVKAHDTHDSGDSQSESSKNIVRKLNNGERENTCPIQFVQRDLAYNTCRFIASNLADPSDFAHFMYTKLSEQKTGYKTSKMFRIMPVEAVCEAKSKTVEKYVLPLIQKKLGQNDEPLRFSLIYRGKNAVDSLSQQEAKAIIRNCIWAVNPNCVQCIKYQDYAVVMHLLSPLFLVGICKDFQRLAGYNTWSIRQGPDLTDMGEDSEDEISDDPELDEDDEKKRKLRIKRKRRAEKAGLCHPEGETKRSSEVQEDGQDEDEQDHDEYEQDHDEYEQDHYEDSHLEDSNKVSISEDNPAEESD